MRTPPTQQQLLAGYSNISSNVPRLIIMYLLLLMIPTSPSPSLFLVRAAASTFTPINTASVSFSCGGGACPSLFDTVLVVDVKACVLNATYVGLVTVDIVYADAIVTDFGITIDAGTFTTTAEASNHHPPFHFTLSGFTINNKNSAERGIDVSGIFPSGTQISIHDNNFVFSGEIGAEVSSVLSFPVSPSGITLIDLSTLQFMDNTISITGTSSSALNVGAIQVSCTLDLSNSSRIEILRNAIVFDIVRTGGGIGYVASVIIVDTMTLKNSHFVVDQVVMNSSIQSKVVTTASTTTWMLLLASRVVKIYNSTFELTNNIANFIVLTNSINVELSEMALIKIYNPSSTHVTVQGSSTWGGGGMVEDTTTNDTVWLIVNNTVSLQNSPNFGTSNLLLLIVYFMDVMLDVVDGSSVDISKNTITTTGGGGLVRMNGFVAAVTYLTDQSHVNVFNSSTVKLSGNLIDRITMSAGIDHSKGRFVFILGLMASSTYTIQRNSSIGIINNAITATNITRLGNVVRVMILYGEYCTQLVEDGGSLLNISQNSISTTTTTSNFPSHIIAIVSIILSFLSANGDAVIIVGGNNISSAMFHPCSSTATDIIYVNVVLCESTPLKIWNNSTVEIVDNIVVQTVDFQLPSFGSEGSCKISTIIDVLARIGGGIELANSSYLSISRNKDQITTTSDLAPPPPSTPVAYPLHDMLFATLQLSDLTIYANSWLEVSNNNASITSMELRANDIAAIRFNSMVVHSESSLSIVGNQLHETFTNGRSQYMTTLRFMIVTGGSTVVIGDTSCVNVSSNTHTHTASQSPYGLFLFDSTFLQIGTPLMDIFNTSSLLIGHNILDGNFDESGGVARFVIFLQRVNVAIGSSISIVNTTMRMSGPLQTTLLSIIHGARLVLEQGGTRGDTVAHEAARAISFITIQGNSVHISVQNNNNHKGPSPNLLSGVVLFFDAAASIMGPLGTYPTIQFRVADNNFTLVAEVDTRTFTAAKTNSIFILLSEKVDWELDGGALMIEGNHFTSSISFIRCGGGEGSSADNFTNKFIVSTTMVYSGVVTGLGGVVSVSGNTMVSNLQITYLSAPNTTSGFIPFYSTQSLVLLATNVLLGASSGVYIESNNVHLTTTSPSDPFGFPGKLMTVGSSLLFTMFLFTTHTLHIDGNDYTWRGTCRTCGGVVIRKVSPPSNTSLSTTTITHYKYIISNCKFDIYADQPTAVDFLEEGGLLGGLLLLSVVNDMKKVEGTTTTSTTNTSGGITLINLSNNTINTTLTSRVTTCNNTPSELAAVWLNMPIVVGIFGSGDEGGGGVECVVSGNTLHATTPDTVRTNNDNLLCTVVEGVLICTVQPAAFESVFLYSIYMDVSLLNAQSLFLALQHNVATYDVIPFVGICPPSSGPFRQLNISLGVIAVDNITLSTVNAVVTNNQLVSQHVLMTTYSSSGTSSSMPWDYTTTPILVIYTSDTPPHSTTITSCSNYARVLSSSHGNSSVALVASSTTPILNPPFPFTDGLLFVRLEACTQSNTDTVSSTLTRTGNSPSNTWKSTTLSRTPTLPTTPTITHPATPSSTASLSSSALTHTSTDTHTDTVSITGATATRCEISDSIYQPPCSLITDVVVSSGSVTAPPRWLDTDPPGYLCTTPATTTSTTSDDMMIAAVSVPFSLWSSGQVVTLHLRVAAHIGTVVIPRGPRSNEQDKHTLFLPPTAPIPGDSDQSECVVAAASKGSHSLMWAGPNGGAATITLEVRYIGIPTLIGVSDVIRFPTHGVFRCPVNTSGNPYPYVIQAPPTPETGTATEEEDGGSLTSFPLSASILLGIRIEFESVGPEPPALDPTVNTGAVVGAVGSIISGMPSGIVRGGMVSSLRGMLRCSEFDPYDETDRINNPPMIPVLGLGSSTEEKELLQYKRGSVVLGAGIIGVAIIVVIISAAVQLASSSGANTWSEALTVLRLPSMILPIALLVGEMSSGSAVSLIVYHPPSSSSRYHRSTPQSITDALLAIIVFGSVWVVFLYCAYATTIGCLVEAAPIEEDDNDDATESPSPRSPQHRQRRESVEVELLSVPSIVDDDVNDDDLRLSITSLGGDHNNGESDGTSSASDQVPSDNNTNKQKHRGSGRVLHGMLKYVLEPTHGPVLPQRHRLSAASTIEVFELWLRRHYFFVAERRWIAYGAIEVIAGSLVDVAEGIPVTSRTLSACAMPPAIMTLLLLGLLITLLWKWPLAVRLQQWGALAINGLMFVAAVLVTVNVFVASVALEEVASYFIMMTSLLIAIFSTLDIFSWLLLIIPSLRGLMGLRVMSLATSLAQMRRDAHISSDCHPQHTNIPRYSLAMLVDEHGRTREGGEEIGFYKVAMEVLMHRLRQTSTQQQAQSTSSSSAVRSDHTNQTKKPSEKHK